MTHEVTITNCRVDDKRRVYVPSHHRTAHGIETGEEYDVRLDVDGDMPFRTMLLADGRFRIPAPVYKMESFDVTAGDTVDVTFIDP